MTPADPTPASGLAAGRLGGRRAVGGPQASTRLSHPAERRHSGAPPEPGSGLARRRPRPQVRSVSVSAGYFLSRGGTGPPARSPPAPHVAVCPGTPGRELHPQDRRLNRTAIPGQKQLNTLYRVLWTDSPTQDRVAVLQEHRLHCETENDTHFPGTTDGPPGRPLDADTLGRRPGTGKGSAPESGRQCRGNAPVSSSAGAAGSRSARCPRGHPRDLGSASSAGTGHQDGKPGPENRPGPPCPRSSRGRRGCAGGPSRSPGAGTPAPGLTLRRSQL
nr:collagen alpha-1(I) chain-like [Kogia breviceps]